MMMLLSFLCKKKLLKLVSDAEKALNSLPELTLPKKPEPKAKKEAEKEEE